MTMSGVLTWLARPEAWIAGLAVIACAGLYALLRGAIREGEQIEGPGPRAGYRDAMVGATVPVEVWYFSIVRAEVYFELSEK